MITLKNIIKVMQHHVLPKGYVILTPAEVKTVLNMFDDWERITDFETGDYSADPKKVNKLVIKLGK